MTPKEITNKSILFAVLNWGLGHASRSIVLIEEFIQQRNDITIASDGIALDWLKVELGDKVSYLQLPAYNINYNSNNMSWNMIRQYPKIQHAINKEHRQTKEILRTKKYDLIISDNRYGVWDSKIQSILITHQLSLPSGGKIEKFAFDFQINKWIRGFNKIWIPDYENQYLSGKLSMGTNKIPHDFIGPLSRFISVNEGNPNRHITVILSGPEPQRSMLEKQIANLLAATSYKIIFVRGSLGSSNLDKDRFEIINLAGTEKLQDIFNHSILVITRAGYSSLMDFDVLKIPVVMIPTPDQKEQEYLMKLHEKSDTFSFLNQSEIQSRLLESITRFE